MLVKYKRKLFVMRTSLVVLSLLLNSVSVMELSNCRPPYCFLQMVLVNIMVLLEPKSTVLLSWEIMGVHHPAESFESLSEKRIKPKVSAN